METRDGMRTCIDTGAIGPREAVEDGSRGAMTLKLTLQLAVLEWFKNLGNWPIKLRHVLPKPACHRDDDGSFCSETSFLHS